MLKLVIVFLVSLNELKVKDKRESFKSQNPIVLDATIEQEQRKLI